MSIPSLDPILPTQRLSVRPWPDALIDELGHDHRSGYAERFWLPILGPTTMFFLRRVAAELDLHPQGFELPVLDTARALGLGVRGGRNAPFPRAVARSATFNLSRFVDDDVLEVRRCLPPLNRTKIERLPPALRDEHEAWQARTARTPSAEQERRRARRLALSLAELGEPDEAIERQLHRWKLHPAMAHDALRWARSRQAPASTIAAADGPRAVAPRRPTMPQSPRSAPRPPGDAA